MFSVICQPLTIFTTRLYHTVVADVPSQPVRSYKSRHCSCGTTNLKQPQREAKPMPSVKPYSGTDRDAREADVTTSIYVDSIEPSFTDARCALRPANRARARSPLRSARSKTRTMCATPDVAPWPSHRPSGTRAPRKLRMWAEPTRRTEINPHELEVMVQKRDLLQALKLAMESGCVVLVDSFEKSDWRAYENTTISTVAPKTTRWAALGKLVKFVCASLRRYLTSSPKTWCRV